MKQISLKKYIDPLNADNSGIRTDWRSKWVLFSCFKNARTHEEVRADRKRFMWSLKYVRVSGFPCINNPFSIWWLSPWYITSTQTGWLPEKWKGKSLSCIRLFVTPWTTSTVHGILLAKILQWVAFPLSRVSSQPKDWTQVSRITGRFFTTWATRETQEYWSG